MVSGWVKKSTLGSGPRKGVMLVIADYCNEEARQLGVLVPDGHAVCWAGVHQIAAEAEVSEKTVRRVLDDMEEAGIIRRERRHDGRGWRTYDLIWIEYARRFADLTGWESTREREERAAKERRQVDPKPGKSDRSQSPVGRPKDHRKAGSVTDAPVDNQGPTASEPGGPADSQSGPSGLSGRRPADSEGGPFIGKNRQLEPPKNRQDHLGKVTPDRAGAREPDPIIPLSAGPSARARADAVHRRALERARARPPPHAS